VELAERRELLQWTNHSGGVTSLAFAPDGRTLAMSGEGGVGRIIRLVEVETGTQEAELRSHLRDVSSLASRRTGKRCSRPVTMAPSALGPCAECEAIVTGREQRLPVRREGQA